ncbi:DUF2516 family protein [Demequina oxidasica]|uniref:DUF2516 family protein n=1 Tax=Demequina oxidasica TaxID=676199 RepID=UPI0007834E57|nr:DUF2516 family protein [Demequina oxidasica]
MFAFLQAAIILAISVAAFIAAIFAAVHAAKTSDGAFKAAGKQSKALWLVLMIAATAIAFVSLPWPLGNGSGTVGLLGIISLGAVIFYLVDVKPKVSGFSGGPSGPRNNNRGTW